MPFVIEYDDDARVDLAEAIAMLDELGFDPADDENLANASIALKRLANNREFLGDLLIRRLKADGPTPEERNSGYGPQAIVLSGVRQGYFLRANIWPAKDDTTYVASGASAFVYGVPHDHNFNFLTVGYFGPGYRSDYYEFDYDDVVGVVGERPELRFIEQSALHEGKLQLYRAHVDIHSQIPPESMSVSINVMHVDPGAAWYDQYGFDLDSGEITRILNPTSTEAFLRIAVGLGSNEALDLAETFGRSHPSDRLRLASFDVRAMLEPGLEARDALWAIAERSGSLLVAREAARRRRNLELA